MAHKCEYLMVTMKSIHKKLVSNSLIQLAIFTLLLIALVAAVSL